MRTVHAVRDGLIEATIGMAIHPGDLPLLDDACRLGQPLVVDDVSATGTCPKLVRTLR